MKRVVALRIANAMNKIPGYSCNNLGEFILNCHEYQNDKEEPGRT